MMYMEDDDIIKKLVSSYVNVDKVFSDFTALLKFVIYENFGERLCALYSVINDNDKFSSMIEILGGGTVEFPTKDEFKSAITLTLIYYYKEVMGYNWKKIEELVPYEKDISLRYGSKLRNVKKTIKKKLNEMKDSDSSIFEI